MGKFEYYLSLCTMLIDSQYDDGIVPADEAVGELFRRAQGFSSWSHEQRL